MAITSPKRTQWFFIGAIVVVVAIIAFFAAQIPQRLKLSAPPPPPGWEPCQDNGGPTPHDYTKAATTGLIKFQIAADGTLQYYNNSHCQIIVRGQSFKIFPDGHQELFDEADKTTDGNGTADGAIIGPFDTSWHTFKVKVPTCADYAGLTPPPQGGFKYQLDIQPYQKWALPVYDAQNPTFDNGNGKGSLIVHGQVFDLGTACLVTSTPTPTPSIVPLNPTPTPEATSTPKPKPQPTEAPECSNGRDDDGDGKVDMNDPECHVNGNIHNQYNPNGHEAQCSDTIDNDKDGKIDGADPGCHTDGDAHNAFSYDTQRDSEKDKAAASAPKAATQAVSSQVVAQAAPTTVRTGPEQLVLPLVGAGAAGMASLAAFYVRRKK